jgi:hypothetical protein
VYHETSHLFGKGDPFLRLVFHEIKTEGLEVESDSIADDDYKRNRLEESLSYPDTFLDVPGRLEEVRSELFEDIQRSTLSQLVVFLGVLTAVFALWNIAGVHLLDRQRQIIQADTTDTRPVNTPSDAVPPISPLNSAAETPNREPSKKE